MKKNQGFSLLEVLIVIAIIGIVSAILAPSISGILSNSKFKVDIGSAQIIAKSAELYLSEYGNEENLLEKLKESGYIKDIKKPQSNGYYKWRIVVNEEDLIEVYMEGEKGSKKMYPENIEERK